MLACWTLIWILSAAGDNAGPAPGEAQSGVAVRTAATPGTTSGEATPTGEGVPIRTRVPSANGDSTTAGVSGLWIGPAELAALPTSGAAWASVKAAADSDLSGGSLTTRDDHNVRTMAAALVAARLDDDGYRARVREALRELVASPPGSDALAAARRLGTYAISADLISLATFDPAFDREFRIWLRAMRDHPYSSGTIVSLHERRPNNWGTHAGASRLAVDLYLGDGEDVQRAAAVFRGWLGERAAYAGFTYGDLSWQCDPERPVGVNPRGCTKEGHALDGVIPDDQRRCGAFQWPPCRTNYAWEALQGALAQAWLLHRQGLEAFAWGERALLRAIAWLYTQADYPAEGDDTWQLHLINHVYGTAYPAPTPARPGKNVGWTDWTHGSSPRAFGPQGVAERVPEPAPSPALMGHLLRAGPHRSRALAPSS